jgi:GDP/UDP-N,N'-diacetylbacillosamine 2-epimerase (hydrolysing)
MMSKRKILLITERRADYSRFKPILKLINKSKYLDYILVVTGTHLLKNHGKTINEIKKDKFRIDYKIKSFSSSKADDGESMVVAIGNVLKKISLVIKKSKPDIILTGFDIGANFALTVAGAHLNIPVAHIQGGEVTGSIDESLRHSMSKFSNYHLVANLDAKKRLIRMGEQKNKIFIVGCPSLDALFQEPVISDEEIKKRFKIDCNKLFFIVIQHPVTTEHKLSKNQILETIQAIKKTKAQALFILPNNDSGHLDIINEIRKNNLNCSESLSLSEYRSLLMKASILIGNSSSGIHEAASFRLPVINIGSRQNGRLQPKNVNNVDYNRKNILNKIKFCLNNDKYITSLKKLQNPYGDGNSASKIIKVLKKINLLETTQKRNSY